MILSAIHICYDPSHHPFATEGAVKIERLDPGSSGSKIIRAVIRDKGIDATSWESYSLHRCYCRSEKRETRASDDLLDPRLTLEELGIEEGHSLFIRKTDSRKEVEDINQRTSTSTSKRKRIQDGSDSGSTARGGASFTRSSIAPATNNASNLENLSGAAMARSISKLLGGDQWKTQAIGQIGIIKTRSEDYLQVLRKLVKTSLELPQVSEQDAGLFNSDLVEALIRAYHQRITSPEKHGEKIYTNRLSVSDYERATELLRGKINQDGSWERGSLAHLDASALFSREERFPLSDSGLSGQYLTAARAICALWNNDKWLKQAPLSGLAPVSLKDGMKNATLRKMAELTRVKPGEATPDGFPSTVLHALQEAIKQRESSASSIHIGRSKLGWSQSKDVTRALEILLKSHLKEEQMAHSTFADYRPSKKMRIESLLNSQLL